MWVMRRGAWRNKVQMRAAVSSGVHSDLEDAPDLDKASELFR